MASSNNQTRTETTYEFAVTHADFVAMMNDPNVLLQGGHVSPTQEFTLYLRKSSGSEIILKDMDPTDTLVVRFGVVSVLNSQQGFGSVDVQP